MIAHLDQVRRCFFSIYQFVARAHLESYSSRLADLADLKGLIYRQDAEFEIERIYIKSSRLFHDKLVWCVDVVDEIFHVSDLMAGRLGVVYLTESQQCIFSEPGDWGVVVNIEKNSLLIEYKTLI